MQLLPALDNVLYNVQRQGKISFYVSVQHKSGSISVASSLNLDDGCEFEEFHLVYN
jgi:2-oxoisovalerate dehydrogenase E1 component alpha subunit